MQLCAGEIPVWMLTGALVMEASWGMAKTPATRAMMTVEYFMLIEKRWCEIGLAGQM